MKLFFVLIFFVLFLSCSITPEISEEQENRLSWYDFRSEYEIDVFVSNLVLYVKDDTLEDWKTPQRTLEEGGDCEDKAILFIYLCKKYLEKKDCEIKIEFINYYVPKKAPHCYAIYGDYVYNKADFYLCQMSISYEVALSLCH